MDNFNITSPPKLLAHEEKSIHLAQTDLIAFGKFFLRPDFLRSETPFFHYEISEAYMNDKDRKQLAVIVARGHAKCLSAEMEVLTSEGNYVPVNELRIGEEIICIDQRTLKLTKDIVKDSSFSGIQQTYEIITRTGRRIVASKGHRVLTFDGWKRVKEGLKVGDLVASTRHQRNTTYGSMSVYEIKLLAHLLMEGGLSQNSVLYTNSDKLVIDDCRKCAEELGFTFKYGEKYTYKIGGSRRSDKRYMRRVSIVKEWATRWGIMGHTALTKRIPIAIFGQSDQMLWEFINVVMATDGWFAVESGCAGVTLANEGLIDDLRKIFNRVGIITTKFYRPNNHAGAWSLQFGRDGIDLLIRKCDLFHKRERAAEILKKDGYSLIDIYPNKLWKYKKHKSWWYRKQGLSVGKQYRITREKLRRAIELDNGNDVWSHYEEADVFWDEIISIKPYKKEKTFDISTKRHHNFIVDGLVVHNTVLTKAFIINKLVYQKKTDPPVFIAWVSDTLSKSFNNVEYVSKYLEYDGRIRRYFGKLGGRGLSSTWTKQDLATIYESKLVSRSNVRSIRGETIGSILGGTNRFTYVILDDIESIENTKTQESRENIRKGVTNTVYPALDENRGRLILNGTPVNPDSLCQRILDGYIKAMEKNEEDKYSWKVITYKATQPDMPGGVLWPSYIPQKSLDRKKQFYIDTYGNDTGYYQEYELLAQGSDDRIWTADHYKFHDASYQWDGQSYLRWSGRRFPVNCFIGCDPATDINTRKSDKSVVLVIAVDDEGRVFVLEYISKRAIPQLGLRDDKGVLVGELGVVDHIFELYDRYHCLNATVEDVAMTRGVMQDIYGEKYRRHRQDMMINSIKPGGKEKRNKIIRGLSRYFAHRMIYVRKEHTELREQIENMGLMLLHDDVLESLFFSVQNMYKPGFQKEGFNEYTKNYRPEVKSWVVL